jgi:Lrp/AsnC family transcriptional regulator
LLAIRIVAIPPPVNENVRSLERLSQGQSSPTDAQRGEITFTDASVEDFWVPMPSALALEHADLFFIKNIANRDNDEACPGSFRHFFALRSLRSHMDATDTKILMLLQEDASISIAELAQRVNLSQTPCWKRIQRLEATGVIEKRVALVNPEKVGLDLTVFVSIEIADHSGQWLQRFAEFVSAMPEVMEFYRMAGEVDYMLRVAVPDMAAYDRLYQRLVEAVPLKNVTSRFAMQRVKSTTAYDLVANGER